MFEIVFIDKKTGRVNYAIRTRLVSYITMSSVGYVANDGRIIGCTFTHTEKLEVDRIEQ